MDGDKKTLKFQMMMSPAEAKELDDWMFKNRIRSRAEAIRRLTQIGLIADGSNTMKLAVNLIAHFIEDPEAKKKMLSGMSLEQDIRHLCWAVMQEKNKQIGFRTDQVDEALASATRLAKEFADLEKEAYQKNGKAPVNKED